MSDQKSYRYLNYKPEFVELKNKSTSEIVKILFAKLEALQSRVKLLEELLEDQNAVLSQKIDKLDKIMLHNYDPTRFAIDPEFSIPGSGKIKLEARKSRKSKA